jgi:hypothetical protein
MQRYSIVQNGIKAESVGNLRIVYGMNLISFNVFWLFQNSDNSHIESAFTFVRRPRKWTVDLKTLQAWV